MLQCKQVPLASLEISGKSNARLQNIPARYGRVMVLVTSCFSSTNRFFRTLPLGPCFEESSCWSSLLLLPPPPLSLSPLCLVPFPPPPLLPLLLPPASCVLANLDLSSLSESPGEASGAWRHSDCIRTSPPSGARKRGRGDTF